MQVNSVNQLRADQAAAVLALVEAASRVDDVAPLSEQVLLAVRSDLPAGTSTASTSTPEHLLAYAGTHLAGYAHLERGLAGAAATAEVVVDPAHRRQGVGTALIRALEEALLPDAATLQIWSHGHLDGARALAARDGYVIVRELRSMRRPLGSGAHPLPDVQLPEGFTVRHFVVGQDEDAWLRVNARAFVHHPEQGRMTRADLDQRIAQSWFDATGLILIEHTRAGAPVLTASHWTKVVPAENPGVSQTNAEASPTDAQASPTDAQASPTDAQASPTQGEVYVVGVDPAYQGLGLGRAVTVLGLLHLRERGLDQATLYVDADNTAAVATYSRLGFTRFAVDVMYSHSVHLPVSG